MENSNTMIQEMRGQQCAFEDGMVTYTRCTRTTRTPVAGSSPEIYCFRHEQYEERECRDCGKPTSAFMESAGTHDCGAPGSSAV